MFNNLDPQDISKKPFKSFKNFSFDNNDSGSGIFLIKARSGSRYNYISGSDVVTPITSGVSQLIISHILHTQCYINYIILNTEHYISIQVRLIENYIRQH